MNRLSLPRLLLAAALVTAAACGQSRAAAPASAPIHAAATPANPTTDTVSGPPTPVPAATAAASAGPPLACTASGANSGFEAQPPGATPSTIASATASGDTLTLQFAHGTPAFDAGPTSSPRYFLQNGPITLAGSAGFVISFHGFRGDVDNYTGPQSLRSTGPLLLEVRNTEDFEGYFSFGVGLSAPGCANVTAHGSTLTFRFIPLTGK